MMKRILYIVFFAVLLFVGAPGTVSATQSMELIDNEASNISLTVQGATIRVNGANGQVMQIYNVAGICVKTIKVEGEDKQFDLNLPKGCYIVKIGVWVRKISVR